MNVIIVTFLLWVVIEMSFAKSDFGIMMLLLLNRSSGSVIG